jgi:putative chitinase
MLKPPVDLIDNPDLATTPLIGSQIACLYFASRGIPAMCNASNWYGVRYAVNGGYTGIDYFLRCVDALLALPNLATPRTTVTSLYVNDSLWSLPTMKAPSVRVADLEKGCTFQYLNKAPTDADGLTPHWVYMKVLTGTTQKLRPAAGVVGWGLRGNLQTRFV